jgi:hypothetical protein
VADVVSLHSVGRKCGAQDGDLGLRGARQAAGLASLPWVSAAPGNLAGWAPKIWGRVACQT